jgi:hypothetical protein
MTCYGVGEDFPCREATGAATIPKDVPPDQSNI